MTTNSNSLTEDDLFEGKEESCGCSHAAKKMPGQPRRIVDPYAGEPLVAIEEPLIAVEEGEGVAVYSCGPCGNNQKRPTSLFFDKMKRGTNGDFEVAERIESPLKFSGAQDNEGFDSSGPSCLPWVKVTRDPKRFRACLAQARKYGRITGSESFYNIVKDFMTAEDQEVFYVLLLDTQLQVRGISELARGARDRTLTPIPDVLRIAIIDGAMAFCIAHNHPSGPCEPSKADKELTKSIKEAADAVGILMMDHIVVGAGSGPNGDGPQNYYSFDDHGEC